jgi:hypothetical protein
MHIKMKTLSEVKREVIDVINSTHWLQTRIEALKVRGYAVTFNWVTNGEIGVVWHIKRKNIYRMQVSESEKHGDYDKAYCIEIPVVNASLQESDNFKVRRMPAKERKKYKSLIEHQKILKIDLLGENLTSSQ